MSLTDPQRLAALAVECVMAIDQKRLRRARKGHLDSSRAGIPWRRLLELVDEIERQYPGVLDNAYAINARQDNEHPDGPVGHH